MVLVLAAASALSCRGKSRAKPASDRLVSDDELATLAADLSTRLAANRDRRCGVVVAGHTPVDGPAGGELTLLMEPGGALAACARAVTDLGPRVRALSFGRALDDAEMMTPELAAVEARCAALPRAIEVAAARNDACSPYLPGRRMLPEHPGWDTLGVAAALIIRSRARAGDVVGALGLVRDVVRVSQDFARGGVDALTAATAATPADYALAVAEAILGSPAPLGAEAARELASQLTTLLGSEPHPSGLLAGDNLRLATLIEIPARGQGTTDGGAPGEHPGDIAGIALLGLADNVRDQWQQCNDSATFDGCLLGLASPPRPPDEPPPRDRRRELNDSERALFAPPIDVIRRAARRYVRLGALRLHVKLRELTASSRACPGIEIFDGPLALYRKLSLLAAPLSISAAPEGRFIVTAPASAGIEGEPLWQLDPLCESDAG